MTKRERVMAALRGAPVDRVPVSLWLHNFATENSPDTLAAETLRLARRFDWDFLKPQSRAQCFAEMWGFRYTPSRERAASYTVTETPLTTAADLRRLAQAVALVRSDPTAVDHALDAMAVTLESYARAAVESGADGLFYATNMATRELSTAAECRRFQRPYDLRILGRVESAPFNLLHVCGTGILFDEFTDYPMAALSFATVPSNPSLKDAHTRTGRAVIGGLPAKPEIRTLAPGEVAARGRRAIAEMGGRSLLLGPDCSIDPDTPDSVMEAATAASH